MHPLLLYCYWQTKYLYILYTYKTRLFVFFFIQMLLDGDTQDNQMPCIIWPPWLCILYADVPAPKNPKIYLAWPFFRYTCTYQIMHMTGEVGKRGRLCKWQFSNIPVYDYVMWDNNIKRQNDKLRYQLDGI